jgi:hypothetical protein
MDELVVDGEKYISSKRAARLSGYTKDYIGQLCRAGKIPSKMVGRSWYVKEDSLKEHRKEYQGEPVVDPSLWEESHAGATFKGFGGIEPPLPKPRLTEEHIKISYEPDPRPLIPTVSPRPSVQSTSTSSVEVQESNEPQEFVVHERNESMHVGKALEPRVPPVPLRSSEVPPKRFQQVARDISDEDDVVVIDSFSPRRNYLLEVVLITLVLVCGLLLLFEKENVYRDNSLGTIELTETHISFWNVGSEVKRLWER